MCRGGRLRTTAPVLGPAGLPVSPLGTLALRGVLGVLSREGGGRAFAHLVAAAPGAKESDTVGKVVHLARHDAPLAHDVLIADGPSSSLACELEALSDAA